MAERACAAGREATYDRSNGEDGREESLGGRCEEGEVRLEGMRDAAREAAQELAAASTRLGMREACLDRFPPPLGRAEAASDVTSTIQRCDSTSSIEIRVAGS